MKLAGLGLGLGLGFSCNAQLSPVQLYQLALDAGFAPGFAPDTGSAGTMAAIAMHESRGCADATNFVGEHSYGLWQINVDVNTPTSLGLTDPNQLLDPSTNVQAAYQLWAGNDANLNILWFLNHSNIRPSYLSFLSQVQSAVQAAGIDAGGGSPTLASVTGGLSNTAIAFALASAIGIAFFLGRE